MGLTDSLAGEFEIIMIYLTPDGEKHGDGLCSGAGKLVWLRAFGDRASAHAAGDCVLPGGHCARLYGLQPPFPGWIAWGDSWGCSRA
jgi:hypothetical protein